MTASAVFERPLSMADLGYISFGYRSTDIDQDVSQSVIEGKGVIDDAELQRAVSVVAKALPACQFVLTGTARARHWKAAGPLPEVRTIHRDWDGHYREDLDFLERTFDLCRGPVAEVVQIVSSKTFLVFRIHHAVMDGMGMSEFVRAFFRALRHEALENFYSTYTLENLVETKIRQTQSQPLKRAVTPLGNRHLPSGRRPRQREWRRIKVKINDKMALPVLAVVLAKLAREVECGPIRFSLPINLRRHVPHEKTSANLVGIIKVDVDENETARSFVKKTNAMLREELDLPSEREIKGHNFFKTLPLPLLRLIGKMLLFLVFRSKFFNTSGTLSSLGKIPLDQLSCDSFEAQTFFAISISPTGSPLFAAICSSGSEAEITLSATKQMAAEDKLLKLAERVKAQFETFT